MADTFTFAGKEYPAAWNGATYSMVKNPFFDYRVYSAYMNQGETRADLGAGYEWLNPSASVMGIPSIGADDRPTFSRSWTENPNDARGIIPTWYGGESGYAADPNSAPAEIVRADPAFVEWASARWAYLHPAEYAAEQAESNSGAFNLSSFMSEGPGKVLLAAATAYAVSLFGAAQLPAPVVDAVPVPVENILNVAAEQAAAPVVDAVTTQYAAGVIAEQAPALVVDAVITPVAPAIDLGLARQAFSAAQVLSKASGGGSASSGSSAAPRAPAVQFNPATGAFMETPQGTPNRGATPQSTDVVQSGVPALPVGVVLAGIAALVFFAWRV